MMFKRKILCVISSSGGHLNEALTSISKVSHDVVFITKKDPQVKSMLAGYKVNYINDPHTSIVGFIFNAIKSLCLLLSLRPGVILSTGAGIAIPFCLIGRYLFRAKIIFIETGARVTTPSRTGKFMYKYSDRFIVQWKPLLKHYPEAEYGGPLL